MTGRKGKTRARVLAAGAFMLSLLLGSCGGGYSTAAQTDGYYAESSSAASYASESYMAEEAGVYEMEDAETAPKIAMTGGDGEGAAPALGALAEGMKAGSQEESARKIVKHSYLSLETKEFDRAVEQLTALVDSLGGYIENQRVDGRSMDNMESYYERSAEIDARIPADKLDEAVAAVDGICNVVSKSENAENISDQYYDAQAHLRSLNLQEERLLEILEKAEKLEEVISLEQALSEVRYEIESLTASIRRMDSQVAYSYLNMQLREVVEYNLPVTAPKTFGERFSAAAARSGENVVSSLQDAALALVELGPVLILWAAIIGGVIFGVSRIVKRSRRVKTRAAKIAEQAKPAPPEPENTDKS